MVVKRLLVKLNLKYIPAIAYMILIFYMSSIPLELPEILDKLDPTKFTLHVAEYTILGYLLFIANKRLRISFIVSSFYGFADELHQYFVPFRTFSLFDVFADILGSLIGVILAYKLSKIYYGRTKAISRKRNK
jgi:VanZ family protein